ncbi:RidA family protein [Rhabdobacter roseus]|uniref:2-iminobutanoate/2-iminopropanoate deaminase n=1 Tax=Rhabdobacter roseus TaxID=1655419 RepID=A0A840TYW6_9BACT|nr:RidA family protein [Rhabdobacter roseus]MBB5285388.1 2-iminobutanoate/2-iminopropanoate deaminase [Rhabdobacter roseus]
MNKAYVLLLWLGLGSTLAPAQTRIIRTDQAPTPVGPYSQAVEANGFLFVAGQVGLNPATGKLVEGGIEQEVPQIMKNIEAILKAAGTDLTHIVNTTIFMKDLKQFGTVNELYSRYFSQNYPARTTVGAAELPAGGAIEIAVVAALPRRKGKK